MLLGQSVSIVSRPVLGIHALVGQHEERYRLREMPAVLEQKVRNLLPRNGNLLERLIHCIDQQNHFDRRSGLLRTAPESLKGENLAGLVVVQQCEVLEFQTGYRRSRLVGDHYIEIDRSLLLFGLEYRGRSKRRSLGRGRRCGLGRQ